MAKQLDQNSECGQCNERACSYGQVVISSEGVTVQKAQHIHFAFRSFKQLQGYRQKN